MNILHKLSSLILSFTILTVTALCCCGITASAENRIGYVDATGVNMREKPTTSSKAVMSGLSHVTVTIIGEEKDSSGVLWYKVNYDGKTGYICSVYQGATLVKIIEPATDKSFEDKLKAFPESYRSALRTLHAVYPNWVFIADNIDMTLDEAVVLETPKPNSATPITYKLIDNYNKSSWFSTGYGAYSYDTGKWDIYDARYYMASRELVRYYMDPRNFLNADYIYMFMQQYNTDEPKTDGLRKVVAGTFLNTDEYIDILMQASKASNINPNVLAAKIIQEQGSKGISGLISGTYSFPVSADSDKKVTGYYNYFNYSAYGKTESDKIVNGLRFAYDMGWSSPLKSIVGGAQRYESDYAARGQLNFYYMDYNIKNPKQINHQYATAVYDARSKAAPLKKSYAEDFDSNLKFSIPVYKNMGAVAELPAQTDKLNNYYFNSISVSGLTPSFSKFTYSYDLKIGSNAAVKDRTVKVTVPSGAAYTGAKHFKLIKGENTVTLTVKAQTGYTTDYKISVLSDKACVLYVDSGSGITLVAPDSETEPSPTPEVKVMCGDTNGDSKINGRDLANVQMHILEVKLLTGDGFKGGDTNGDGKINGRDLANVQMHILGVKTLT